MGDSSVLFLIIGLAVGGGAAVMVLRARAGGLEKSVADTTARVTALEEELKATRADAATARTDAATAAVRAEGAERRQQELATELVQLTSQVQNRDQTISQLKVTEAEVRQRWEESERQRFNELQAKQSECDRLIAAEKDRYEALEAAKERAHEESLRAKQVAIDELKNYIQKADETLKATFGDASTRALQKATENFLDLAKKQFDDREKQSEQTAELRKKELERLLDPIQKELDELETLNREIEKSRAESEGSMKQQIERLHQTSESLANALKKPGVRGAWGEAQLKQILESAGMVEGQNYRVQDSTDDQGEVLRTDVVIMLPKGREIVIDSKAPLDQYWLAMGALTEDERTARALDHAKAVRGHVRALKQKEYWKRYAGSPDYVILFLPHEGAYQLACEHDKALLTDAQSQKIVLANPMTLMNLVHLATYVMQEERLQENAEQIRAVGSQLIQRLGKVMEFMDKHGQHLRKAVESYNQSIASLDSRLVPAARQMQGLGVSRDTPLPEMKSVDNTPRQIAMRDFTEPSAPTLSLPLEGLED